MDLAKYLQENWELDKVPAEKREQYLTMIGELIYRNFTDEAVMLLDDAQQKQLENLLELPGTNPISVLNFYTEVLGEDTVQKMIQSQSQSLRQQVTAI